ncbi:hypothetical protein Bbelb_372530 [Branchiostoma belcheri]|nr:hypothetical protein Bbelb_372530 [Branchiostoma belcheri]
MGEWLQDRSSRDRCGDPPTFSSGVCDVIEGGNTCQIGLILFEFLSPIATLFLPVPNMTENRCEDPPTFSSGFCDVIATGNTCQVPQGNTAIVKTHYWEIVARKRF